MLAVCACARLIQESLSVFSYMYQIHPGKKPLVHWLASARFHLFPFAGFVVTGNCEEFVYAIVSVNCPSASAKAESVHPLPWPRARAGPKYKVKLRRNKKQKIPDAGARLLDFMELSTRGLCLSSGLLGRASSRILDSQTRKKGLWP